jgi:hypothetical protein
MRYTLVWVFWFSLERVAQSLQDLHVREALAQDHKAQTPKYVYYPHPDRNLCAGSEVENLLRSLFPGQTEKIPFEVASVLHEYPSHHSTRFTTYQSIEIKQDLLHNVPTVAKLPQSHSQSPYTRRVVKASIVENIFAQ